jgi:uncharacterized protein (TIGR02147 family)
VNPKHHYSNLLQAFLDRKSAENSRFSLRAFSRQLGISASQLSRILSRKAPLTLDCANKIAPILYSASSGKQEFFIDIVRLCNSGEGEPNIIEFLFNKLLSLDSGELDQARLRCLSDWSVVATFDAFGLAKPPRSLEDLASMLGVSLREAEVALRQLEHAQLLEPVEGWYQRKVEQFYTTCDVPSAIIRNLHRQLIGKAMQAIDGQDVSRRYLRGMSLSLNSELLPRVRELVEAFCLEVEKLEQESSGSADSLYQLNLQFFDLLSPTKQEKKNETA